MFCCLIFINAGVQNFWLIQCWHQQGHRYPGNQVQVGWIRADIHWEVDHRKHTGNRDLCWGSGTCQTLRSCLSRWSQSIGNVNSPLLFCRSPRGWNSILTQRFLQTLGGTSIFVFTSNYFVLYSMWLRLNWLVLYLQQEKWQGEDGLQTGIH